MKSFSVLYFTGLAPCNPIALGRPMLDLTAEDVEEGRKWVKNEGYLVTKTKASSRRGNKKMGSKTQTSYPHYKQRHLTAEDAEIAEKGRKRVKNEGYLLPGKDIWLQRTQKKSIKHPSPLPHVVTPILLLHGAR